MDAKDYHQNWVVVPPDCKRMAMSQLITKVHIKNYRALADVSVDLRDLNVFFGPNGAGKSTFLDTVWFVRDCAIRSVELASAARSHGIGLLFDGAGEGEQITVAVSTGELEYQLTLGLSSGRIDPFAGEILRRFSDGLHLISRAAGSDKADFYNAGIHDPVNVALREPHKLSLGRYLDFDSRINAAASLDRILHFVHFYHCRHLNLWSLKNRGSEASYETWLWDRGDNLWSVLRNLDGKRQIDERYTTILNYMQQAFPTFDGVVMEATGASSVYGSFLEKGRRKPIRASGVSDGHLQLLCMLTALFAEGKDRDAVLIFDEPEISLHPWAISVLAEAMKTAATSWKKQILLATHSPVLISQFEPKDILVAESCNGQAVFQRLCQISEVQDLLEKYAAGALYMAEEVGKQSVAAPSAELAQ